MTSEASSPVRVVEEVLESYAERGVFRSAHRGQRPASRVTFKVVWHHRREFEIVVDPRRRRIRIPIVLPNVPARSVMDRELRVFVHARHSGALPEHRRIDVRKSEGRVFNRGSNLALTVEVRDGDWEYGIRKLIHLVHEIFLDFLYDGRWRDYMVANFDLPPDAW